ncbi:MAG TPA: glutamyl-tRNA reductase [Luteibaculaceae bacterium]|nr:glutamyl-tRNA reductase [Luteibaculaceae bacterium]
MEQLNVFALTHKKADLKQVGHFHLPQEEMAARLSALKDRLHASELMYLSTCNRVEFIVVGCPDPTTAPLKIVNHFLGNLAAEETNELLDAFEHYSEQGAVKHLFEVAASLDSMVVGEREIITQFRQSYELCAKLGLSGEHIRILAKNTIETAKRIYTDTQLGTRPVSVVSLAFKALLDSKVTKDSRVIMIGAGTTNRNMARFLTKAGFKNVTVFNRTPEKAAELIQNMKFTGLGLGLEQLPAYQNGFDVLISCTGSANTLVDKDLYASLLQGELTNKVLIDLAIPADIDPDIAAIFPAKLINVASLKPISEQNIKAREQELHLCYQILDEALVKFGRILRERKVELAMKQVPTLVKEIKHKAINEVFAREMAELDEKSQEVINRMMEYVEKKYISGPIKLAKEILLTQNS